MATSRACADGLDVDGGEELSRLRKEVRELKMERGIPKQAAALFAKHQR
ncbi:MAG TPA: hypothetical protein VMK12_08190 [Anaeromyxobacteraceae bacterium]|nr:hypothetical protein [Anaeromyxobacteraceae bacterium]